MKNLMVRTQTSGGLFARLGAIFFFAALLTAAPFYAAFAATAPPLGTAQTYGVVAGDSVTNTGPSVVTGDLGLFPGTAFGDFSGFPNGTVTGAINTPTVGVVGAAALAKGDARTAYNNLTSQGCTPTNTFGPTDLTLLSPLGPGVYCFTSSASLSGTLTLTGSATDVWIFKTVSTLITGPGSSVVMDTTGGHAGQACNVFWQIGSAATLDTTTQFIGTILAHDDISLKNGANVSGRLLAGMQASDAGAVTMINNNITPAACTVAVAPTLIKAFDPVTINAGGNSTLTITLSNPNDSAASLTADLIDTLPTGVTFVGINSASNNGCSGSLTNDANTVTLAGGSIPANGSCTVTAVVTSSDVGPHLNTTGILSTDKGNAPGASDTLTVIASASIAPTLSKTFFPANINVGDPSTLTITLGNTNGTNANFALFADTLPIGVTFVDSAIKHGCGGTIANDANTVTLTLGFIPPNGCTVTATVTSLVPGLHLNTTGALVTDKGTAPPASDTLIVNQISQINIIKSFIPGAIVAGGVSLLTITVSNPNNIPIPVAFTDFLPSSPGQMSVATGPDPLTNTCSGSLTATTGSSSVIYEGGLLQANGSCTVTVYVTAPVVGDYTNLLGAASAILHVLPFIPPTLNKDFSPATIKAGGISTLTITLNNPNSTVAGLTAPLIDYLPSGVVIAQTPNAKTTCGGSCTVTAKPGDSKVILTKGSIPAHGSCKVTVDVTAKYKGSYCNKLPAGALQTNIGSNATPAVATLTVNLPVCLAPKLSKYFSPATIKAGGVSTLTITLNNPNSTVARLTAPLIDTLPSGLVVAGTCFNASTTCGGALTANTGGSKVILTGGSIPANGYCTVTVKVTAKCKGSYCNNLPAGALQTDKGPNTAAASATLTVITNSWW